MKSFLAALALCLTAQVARAALSPDTNFTPRELAIAAAAQAGPAPRLNGARILGVRPGAPVICSLAVTGARPMQFSARDLPAGLALDAQTGAISGALAAPGSYPFTAVAANEQGHDEARMTFVCGDTLALTPPMGWNSYDAFGDAVVESEVLSNAIWMKERLQPVGWDTVVVDFRWYDRLANGVRVQNPEGVTIDAFGRCVPPANRFPSAADGRGFGPLADKIHALGLKFGIHIMRGIPRLAVDGNLPIAGSSFTAAQATRPTNDINRTCVWNRDMFGVDASTPAGRAWYDSIARQYAAWGVDFIKCDDICNLQRGEYYDASEIEALSQSLSRCGRSIVLSLSPGPAPLNAAPHLRHFANLFRISSDFWDNWRSLNRNFDLFSFWLPNTIPGHWPDGDMIPLGHICLRNCDVHPDRWTRLTRDEQLTLMSLWALAPSPLMLGMNLPDNDEWTTALLTNPEVIAVDQDAAGNPARRMLGPPQVAEIWSKQLADGNWAVGFFNRTDATIKVSFPWRNLDFLSPPKVRDLWLRRDLGAQERFDAGLPSHGCVLLLVERQP